MASRLNRYLGKNTLRLIDQKIDLDLNYPQSYSYIKEGRLVWYGNVKPTPYSKEYTIKIEYKMGKSPKTWLIKEKLNPKTYGKIPHKYGVDLEKGTVQLCLYVPHRKEWMKSSSIATTIVPWAIEWLYYYEMWQITGKWLGGGEHPK